MAKVKADAMRNIVDNLASEIELFAKETVEACKGVGFDLTSVTEAGKAIDDYGRIVIHIYAKTLE